MPAKLIAVLQKLVDGLDRINEFCGRSIACLVGVMVLLVSYDVCMRYLFQQGSVALQELEWHLFALVFLLGAGYTLKHDDHVRVDVFYRSKFFSARGRAWINLAGCVLFLIPFCLLVIVQSWPFVHNAFLYSEGSPDPGGLPARWLLKSAIPVGFTLLLLQGVSELSKNILRLLRNEP